MQPKREMGDGEGRWKAVEAEKLVLGGADGKEVIGAKRALTFHEHSHQVDALGKRKRVSSKSKPTKWKMVEFVSINSSRAARDDTAPDPMLGDEKEENDDDNGEEEPAPDGGGESLEKHLPEQRPAGGGGAGAQGEQQQPPRGGGAGSHGNMLSYRGAKYFVGVDGSNRSGTHRLSVFGSDDHIGAFYGGGAGSHGNRQPATAEAPHGQHMAALPGDDYRGAKYFVGVDASNRSDTNRLSVFGSDDHIGAFFGGGAGWARSARGTDKKRRAVVPDHRRTSSSNRRQKLRTGEVRRLPVQLHNNRTQICATGNFVILP
ncbi:hypothetical protein SEVIR_5G362601v4 [Setaria viridis]|uniref:NAC domain-containing protein n=1 Tax=Setaria viridis TaxID=4556 RepID=A0A4U6UM61_SETVI|nr:uncharacterized protein LOC117857350 [Setaria viridis]TKW17380.1 hypothetical protein SEVIR_5G362601v2 [Setaria viridis]